MARARAAEVTASVVLFADSADAMVVEGCSDEKEEVQVEERSGRLTTARDSH